MTAARGQPDGRPPGTGSIPAANSSQIRDRGLAHRGVAMVGVRSSWYPKASVHNPRTNESGSRASRPEGHMITPSASTPSAETARGSAELIW
jgi:hypothetical protein